MYSIDDYDDKGVLTPGTFLAIAIAYVSRFLFFGPMSFIARGDGSSGRKNIDLSFFTDISPFEFISSIPAIILLFVLIARNSYATKWMRTVWGQGRHLLILCLTAQLVLQALRVISSAHLSLTEIVFGTVNLFFMIYFVRGTRPKQVFSMFPDLRESDSTKSSA